MNEAAELWESYTDEEKIIWICETIMKLEVVLEHQDLKRCIEGDMGPRYAIYGGKFIFRSTDIQKSRPWNPLDNVDDALEVEKKFTDTNEESQIRYTTAITTILKIEGYKLTHTSILKLTQANGRDRCAALFMAAYKQ